MEHHQVVMVLHQADMVYQQIAMVPLHAHAGGYSTFSMVGKRRKRKKEMETGVTVVITVIVEDMGHLLQVMVVPVATEDFFSCLVEKKKKKKKEMKVMEMIKMICVTVMVLLLVDMVLHLMMLHLTMLHLTMLLLTLLLHPHTQR